MAQPAWDNDHMATQPAPETPEPTPVEAYWLAVYDVIEWVDGQTIVVEQPPLPLPSAA